MIDVDIDLNIRRLKDKLERIPLDDKEGLEEFRSKLGRLERELERNYQDSLYELERLGDEVEEMLVEARMKKQEE